MEVSYPKMPKVTTLNEVIDELHRVFAADDVDVDYVSELLMSYKSNPLDWKKFAKFDRYRYTRNLVNEGNGKFNLMLLCWGPSHTSTIHDHADAHCFMKMLSGSLNEVRFDWPKEGQESKELLDSESDSGMTEIDRNVLKENAVCYINDKLGLHRVENASHSDEAVSLHLYCPPFSSCCMFDERTGKKTKCLINFYSKYGQKEDPRKFNTCC